MKNAAEAAGRKTAGTIRLHTFYDLALRLRRPDGPAQTAAAAGRDHRRRSGHAARDRRRHLRPLRHRAARTAPGWGSRWCRKIIAEHDGLDCACDSGRGARSSGSRLPVAPKDGEEETYDGRHSSCRRRRPHDPHGADPGADPRRVQGARDVQPDDADAVGRGGQGRPGHLGRHHARRQRAGGAAGHRARSAPACR